MEKKKKIILITVAMLLILGGAFLWWWLSRDTAEVPEQEPEEVRPHFVDNGKPNPRSDRLLSPHSTILLTVDSDTIFLIVDSLSNGYVDGRMYLVEAGEEMLSPQHYSLTINRRTLGLVIGSNSYEVAVDDDEIEGLLDGACHPVKLESGEEFLISVNAYDAPDFHATNDQRYRKEIYSVNITKNITYGNAPGYWTSMKGTEGEGIKEILSDWLKKDHTITPQQLDLDLYQPNDTVSLQHPLILFIHGGAFLIGDKSDSAMSQWCRHFASMGYIVACMNYRMGFPISKEGIERTGYMAVQDAHAAMRYLLATDSLHRINQDQLFVAGTSAGSITALNLAFMNESNRPAASRGKGKKVPDLGTIESSGNSYKADFHLRAVANMWGALVDLDMLKDTDVGIVSFHGDADNIVPYDQGYPFSEISSFLGKKLFGKMYGSASIHRYAQRHGIRSQFYPIHGLSHAPHVNRDMTLNEDVFYLIQRGITDFFYRTIVPTDPYILRLEGVRHYALNGTFSQVEWQAEGGVILSKDPQSVEVVWLSDSPSHVLRATLLHPSGLHFTVSYTI